MRLALFVFITANVWFSLGQGARILAVIPVAVHSHFKLGFRLVKELVDRGHEVTFITAYPQKEIIRNLREISVAETIPGLNEKKKTYYEIGTKSYIAQLLWISDLGNFYTENVLNVKAVQDLLQSDEKFDLVLLQQLFNEAMSIFQYKFNCPSVVLASGPTTLFNNHLFANPSQPAYVPNLLANFGPDMTLWQRILNLYYDLIGELFVQFVIIPTQNEILQRVVPGAPDLRSILYNISFMLLASHISLREPLPLQPNIKEIGGYHLLPPKPLPSDLQEFLDNAKEGVIVFSMGSNLRSDGFPQAKKKAVLKVFSRLKQRVLWKFDTNLPAKSKNVKIMSWIPQQDVFAHPNVVLSITHGGLLGVTEAVYFGVPMLGLPVLWDQENNINNAVRKGFALGISFPQMNEENFGWAVHELINNPKYRENAKRSSRIMRDQPMKQIDEAIYWIEYTIRHKGAPHYRSPALSLKWYQRLLLDVILFIGIAVLTIFAIVFYLLKLVLSSSKGKVVKTSKKE